jgi:hypothetical protein
MAVLRLTYEVGPTAAARQLGLQVSTVYGWLNKHRRDTRAAKALMEAGGWWDL